MRLHPRGRTTSRLECPSDAPVVAEVIHALVYAGQASFLATPTLCRTLLLRTPPDPVTGSQDCSAVVILQSRHRVRSTGGQYGTICLNTDCTCQALTGLMRTAARASGERHCSGDPVVYKTGTMPASARMRSTAPTPVPSSTGISAVLIGLIASNVAETNSLSASELRSGIHAAKRHVHSCHGDTDRSLVFCPPPLPYARQRKPALQTLAISHKVTIRTEFQT